MLLLWILVLIVGVAYLAHRRTAPLPALGIVAVYLWTMFERRYNAWSKPAGLAALVLFVWKLRVEASIWRQALDIRRGQALALAIALVLLELMLLVWLAPPVPAAAA